MTKILFSPRTAILYGEKKRQGKNKSYKLINRCNKCQFSDINSTGH